MKFIYLITLVILVSSCNLTESLIQLARKTERVENELKEKLNYQDLDLAWSWNGEGDENYFNLIYLNTQIDSIGYDSLEILSVRSKTCLLNLDTPWFEPNYIEVTFTKDSVLYDNSAKVQFRFNKEDY